MVNNMKIKLLQILIFFGFVLLLYFILLFILNDYNIYFLQIDTCLDKGGEWDYQNNICELSHS
jgi:hypothetical protein